MICKKNFKNLQNYENRIGNKTRIVFVKDRPGHDFRYALNNKKILKKLKWKSKISFDKGLKETIHWYLNNKNF